jgi:hypothetical protein
LSHAACAGRRRKQRGRQTERQEEGRRDLRDEQGVAEERRDQERGQTRSHGAGIDHGVGGGRRLPRPAAHDRQSQPQKGDQCENTQLSEDLEEVVVRVLPGGRKPLELGILVRDVLPGRRPEIRDPHAKPRVVASHVERQPRHLLSNRDGATE